MTVMISVRTRSFVPFSGMAWSIAPSCNAIAICSMDEHLFVSCCAYQSTEHQACWSPDRSLIIVADDDEDGEDGGETRKQRRERLDAEAEAELAAKDDPREHLNLVFIGHVGT